MLLVLLLVLVLSHCCWLVTMVAQVTSALPIEIAMLRSTPSPRVQSPQLDVITVIPTRAQDVELMAYARKTWLAEALPLSHRHFFIISAEDPNQSSLGSEEDLLLVDCKQPADDFRHVFDLVTCCSGLYEREGRLPPLSQDAHASCIINIIISPSAQYSWPLNTIGWSQARLPSFDAEDGPGISRSAAALHSSFLRPSRRGLSATLAVPVATAARSSFGARGGADAGAQLSLKAQVSVYFDKVLGFKICTRMH